jgi:hypothetical protein
LLREPRRLDRLAESVDHGGFVKVPGSHVVRQGGHRTGLALEVEGSEIRDCVHVVTVAGVELWWLARWPVEGTVTANVLKHGVGALNIDGCRISSGVDHAAKCASVVGLTSNRSVNNYGEWTGERTDSYNSGGRWPPNLVFIHAEGCVRVGEREVKTGTAYLQNKLVGAAGQGRYGDYDASYLKDMPPATYGDAEGKETVPAYVCASGCPVAALDEMSGVLTTGAMRADVQRGKLGSHGVYGSSDGSGVGQAVEASSGGASRFFPCFESREEAVEWISRLVGHRTGVE